MRRALFPSILVLLVVGASVGAAGVVAADHETDVTVEGTVTGPDGAPASDAVVLVGEDATLTAFSPDELRDLAAVDPANLTVVETGDDGRFEATIGSRRAEAAVAVSDAGVSDLRYLRGENATLDVRLYERRPQTIHAHLGAVSHDERRADLLISLVNSDDVAVENLSLGVVSLPDGWSIAGAETDGSYDPDAGTVTWPSVAPGTEVDTTLVLTVPEGTPPGEYTVELRAGSDTHRVGVEDETVEVLPEDTPGPTTTPPSGGDGDERTPTADADGETPTATPTARTTGTETTPATGPGLGLEAAVASLALAAALFVRRR